MAMIGPSPMETVGNCQKSGMSHGWGYEEIPPGSTSWRKRFNWSSVSRPKSHARA